jgi:hypothetical protein
MGGWGRGGWVDRQKGNYGQLCTLSKICLLLNTQETQETRNSFSGSTAKCGWCNVHEIITHPYESVEQVDLTRTLCMVCGILEAVLHC